MDQEQGGQLALGIFGPPRRGLGQGHRKPLGFGLIAPAEAQLQGETQGEEVARVLFPGTQESAQGLVDPSQMKESECPVVAGRGDGDAVQDARGAGEVMGIQMQLADVEPLQVLLDRLRSVGLQQHLLQALGGQG